VDCCTYHLCVVSISAILTAKKRKIFEVYNGIRIYRLPMNRGFGRSLPFTLFDVITVGWPFEKLLLQRGVPAEKMTIILNRRIASRENRFTTVFGESTRLLLQNTNGEHCFTITHPFHPLCSQTFPLLSQQVAWGEERVFFPDPFLVYVRDNF
jgi:hypothetical protein